MDDVLLAFRVHRARNLPKTDRFSDIDPYVRVRFGDRIARTRTIQDEPSPDWEELLLLPARMHLNSPGGEVQVELWDEELIDDESVGVAKLSLDDLVRNPGVEREVIFRLLKEYKKKSGDGPPTAWITTSYFLDYPAFVAHLTALRPGTFDVDHKRLVYSPLHELGDNVFLQIDYSRGASRDLSIHILICEPHREDHLDFVFQDGTPAGITRRRFDPPQPRDGLSVHREICIEGVSPIDGLDNLWLVHAQSLGEGAVTVGSLLEQRGLADVIGFKAATRAVAGADDVVVDADDRCIEFPVDQTTLRVLFHGEEVKVEVACYVEGGVFYGLKMDRGSITSEQSVVEDHGRTIPRLSVAHIPIGKSIDHVVIERRQLSGSSSSRLIDLLPLRG